MVLGLLLASSCTLDPRAVIEKASLRVHVDGLTEGGSLLTLTALDSSGRQLVKKANVGGLSEVDVLFESGVVLEGEVDLGAVLQAADGKELACGTARGTSGSSINLSMVRANDDLNCGGCGVLCSGAPHATRSCDRTLAACGAVTCESGWFDVDGDAADGCETTCATPSPENSVAACSDGLDNDCDGKTDCEDEACTGFTRGCSFGACTGEEKWTCLGNSWGACGASASAESSPATCNDGLDNDCDGNTDCDDDGCGGISRSCNVSTCVGQQLYACLQGTFGTCALDETLEATPATCSDGLDNDCDGKTDCQDPGCLNIKQACTGTDLCAAGVRTWLCNVRLFSLCTTYVPVPEDLALLCGDGLDNDCDGKKDCADPDCTGKGCGLGKVCCPSGTCAASCP